MTTEASRDVEPASINAACKLWFVNSGEYEPESGSEHWGVFWEPLNVRLGSDARPHCCYNQHIAFYDHSGNRLLADLVQHYAFLGPHPHLLFLAGKGPREEQGRRPTGKVGREYSVEQAYRHARSVGMDLLAVKVERPGGGVVAASPGAQVSISTVRDPIM